MAVNLYKHIVVVHGIGRQKLNETAINFMNEFCRALPTDERRVLTVKNLVSRDTDRLYPAKSEPAYVVYELSDPAGCIQKRIYIGFSEVYWQPITKGYLAEHHGEPPVPIFTWAQSINSRIRGEQRAGQSLSLWREAIENAEILLDQLSKLATISKKADTFNKILPDFLGDVQMYAEVDDVHDKVNGVFRVALDNIAEVRRKIKSEDGDPVEFDSREIFIVAHSEGTVVSWRSLQIAATKNPEPDWLREVKGFVTFGSPIDKHHLIWGEQNFPADIPQIRSATIPWWNFWDFSDPVGHSLDGIFGDGTPMNNQFNRQFDAGYWRYPVPGKAHVDYWGDINIYHKIIQDVMGIQHYPKPAYTKVENRWWGRLKLPKPGAYVAYGFGRLIEILALLYFLSHLLIPFREAVQHFAWLKALLDVAKKWPFPFPSAPESNLHYVNTAFWIFGAPLIWKYVWDIRLFTFQDEKLNLEMQRRVERVAMAIWGAVLVLVSLDIQTAAGWDVKSLLGWATGLVVTVLVWKIHTGLQKGLVELWRYGLGETKFQPKPPIHEPAPRAIAESA